MRIIFNLDFLQIIFNLTISDKIVNKKNHRKLQVIYVLISPLNGKEKATARTKVEMLV